MSRPNVLVIDAGLGNIGSVLAALQRLDCLVERVKQPPEPKSNSDYTHALLPGVGSFASGIQALQASGWDCWIKEVWCRADRPFLGICLGMQMLASEGKEGSSGEDPVPGLDLIPGRIDRLNVNPDLVLPHVGWNSLEWKTPFSALCRGLPEGGDMYFVHSYIYQPYDLSHGLASSNYGQKFTSVVGRGSCYGVQFHPEKSQRLGRRLLENFLDLPQC